MLLFCRRTAYKVFHKFSEAHFMSTRLWVPRTTRTLRKALACLSQWNRVAHHQRLGNSAEIIESTLLWYSKKARTSIDIVCKKNKNKIKSGTASWDLVPFARTSNSATFVVMQDTRDITCCTSPQRCSKRRTARKVLFWGRVRFFFGFFALNIWGPIFVGRRKNCHIVIFLPVQV